MVRELTTKKTKVGILTQSKVTLTKSLIMGIAMVSASIVIATFLSAIFSPLVLNSLETKPAVFSQLDARLNPATPKATTIPSFVMNHEFMVFDLRNNSATDKLVISGLSFKKLGGIPDKNIGDAKLYYSGAVVARAPQLKGARAAFKDINLELAPGEVKELSLKATVVASRYEGKIAFSLSGNNVQIIYPASSGVIVMPTIESSVVQVSRMAQ